jgi:hypothetical protein
VGGGGPNGVSGIGILEKTRVPGARNSDGKVRF